MNHNSSGAKIFDTPEQFPASSTPTRPKDEFETEGELEVWFQNNQPYFLIDNCQLAEFVLRHFGKRRDDTNRSLGRMKLLFIPVSE